MRLRWALKFRGIIKLHRFLISTLYATTSTSVLFGFTGCPAAFTATAFSSSGLAASITVARAASRAGLKDTGQR